MSRRSPSNGIGPVDPYLRKEEPSMVRAIIVWSLHNRLIVILGTLVLIGAGVYSAMNPLADGSGSPRLVADVPRRRKSLPSGHSTTCWSPVGSS